MSDTVVIAEGEPDAAAGGDTAATAFAAGAASATAAQAAEDAEGAEAAAEAATATADAAFDVALDARTEAWATAAEVAELRDRVEAMEARQTIDEVVLDEVVEEVAPAPEADDPEPEPAKADDKDNEPKKKRYGARGWFGDR